MNDKLKDKLRRIFNKHDPIGIYFGDEVNFDEYDPEISAVDIRFKRSKNLKEFTEEIIEVFTNMFTKLSASQEKICIDLAKETYTLLKEELSGAN
jgi:hypothetical protein